MRFIVLFFMLISTLTYGQGERTILYAKATEFGYRNQFKEAENILSQVIALFPNDSMAYFDRAIMRENLGDTLGAIADLTREIEIDEKSADNYFVRGILYQKTKKYSLALDDFRKVNRLDFGNADAHFFAAQMYLKLQKKMFLVRRQLKQCLQVNPNHAEAQFLLKNMKKESY